MRLYFIKKQHIYFIRQDGSKETNNTAFLNLDLLTGFFTYRMKGTQTCRERKGRKIVPRSLHAQ